MRALNEPDAFPSGDLVLRRMAGDCSARELERRSEAWRPWRAYAVMLLWQAAKDRDQQVPEDFTCARTNDLDLLATLNDDYIQSVQHSNVKRFEEILSDDFLARSGRR